MIFLLCTINWLPQNVYTPISGSVMTHVYTSFRYAPATSYNLHSQHSTAGNHTLASDEHGYHKSS